MELHIFLNMPEIISICVTIIIVTFIKYNKKK